MKKVKISISAVLAVLCCILLNAGVAYATGDDTDGTELQVAQPVILEVQLGTQWAGVEFQLKTDAGLYPGTITVGQDGVLRTELGNSGSYIFSCQSSGVAVPNPSDTQSQNMVGQEFDIPAANGASNNTENAENRAPNTEVHDSDRPSVGGIPVIHLVLFGSGLLLAIGALVAMRLIRNRHHTEQNPYDFDEDDDDYGD